MDQGLHTLDLSRYFLGEFSEVYGQVFTAYWDIDVEDNVVAMMRTSGGATAQVHAGWTEWKNIFSFEICGTDAMAVVEGLGGSYGVHRAKFVRRSWDGPFSEEVYEFRGADVSWAGEWREFTTAIRQNASLKEGENLKFLGSGVDGVEAMKLVEAIYESSKSGRVVKISDAK